MKRRNELMQRLGLAAPVVQGPFGGGYSTAGLVAAVSEAGGLGSFGAHHLGAEGILGVAREIRGLTGKPFALNLWVSNRDFEGELGEGEMARMVGRLGPYYRELGIAPGVGVKGKIESFREQVEAVLEARPAVFSFVFGVPEAEVLRECRKRGIVTVGAATTVAEAVVLEEAGVEMVVASGMEAGGHRPSFLGKAEEQLTGTMALTRQVASAVRIPVIAAGGIGDRKGVEAALVLGAEGAQVGTAFLACEESGAPEMHRRLLLEGGGQRTVLSRVYSGRLARGIRNRLHEELSGEVLLPYPAQGWAVGTLREAAVAQGRTDLVALWCGQAAGLLQLRRAREVVAALGV